MDATTEETRGAVGMARLADKEQQATRLTDELELAGKELDALEEAIDRLGARSSAILRADEAALVFGYQDDDRGSDVTRRARGVRIRIAAMTHRLTTLTDTIDL
jgi:hypothetical protein